MPVTKRKAIKGKQGLNYCINYVLDKDNEGKKYNRDVSLKTGVNCSTEFTLEDFMRNNRKYHNENDERSAYHIVQSFHYEDNITAQQCNEIGVKLVKELYPDFQCLVVTHVDRTCLHNHIIVNATSILGKKLEDRLANKNEGLYGLRFKSDEIAKSYGCKIIEDAPKISRFKSSNILYAYSNESWKSKIQDKINDLKLSEMSFDDMLRKLALDGFEIRNRGKYISIRPYGSKKFTRLHTLGKDYDEETLRKFFFDKTRKSTNYDFKEFLQLQNPYAKKFEETALRSKEAIIKSGFSIIDGKLYPKYQLAKYYEMKKYNDVCRELEILNNDGIQSYNDLLNVINKLEEDIKLKEHENNLKLEEYNSLQRNVPIANIYIDKFDDYQIYQENVEIFGNDNIQENQDAMLFEKAKKELNNISLNEVKKLLNKANALKIEINKNDAYLSYLKNKMSDLEHMRKIVLDKDEHYIKSIHFSNKMIDRERSNNNVYCVKLPYTNQFVYLNKKSVVWDRYDISATMYLINDEEYKIYDKDNNYIQSVSADKLEEISNQEKERIIEEKKKE